MAEQTEKQRAALALGRQRRTEAKQQQKPDVAPKAEPASKLPHPPSLKNQIGLVVGGINQLLMSIPVTAGDALDQLEAETLIEGLDSAQMVSPTLRKYLRLATGGAGWFGLGMALFSIGLPRLARHGFIPWMPPELARRRTDEEIDALLHLKERETAMRERAILLDQLAAEAAADGIRAETAYAGGPVTVPPVFSTNGTAV